MIAKNGLQSTDFTSITVFKKTVFNVDSIYVWGLPISNIKFGFVMSTLPYTESEYSLLSIIQGAKGKNTRSACNILTLN